MRLIIIVLCAIALVSCTKSPTGRSQFAFMSDAQLANMGAESFEQMKQEIPISKNQNYINFVQCVVDQITPNVGKSSNGDNWEVVVFESDQINAFALPGSKIGVYTGILNITENQDQLAAIMGHEIAHVIAKHSNERMSSNQAAAGVQAIVGIALQDQDKQTQTLAMGGLGLFTQYGVLMPYGRTHEKEADIIGQDLMAKSGFNPEAAIDLWRNMAKASKGNPPEFLSTHPSNATRIKKLTENLAVATPLYQKSLPKPQCKKR